MATIIPFPDPNFPNRLVLLRDFVDQAEAERKYTLSDDDHFRLEYALDRVWPGIVAVEPSWKIKFLFASVGFAIGFSFV